MRLIAPSAEAFGLGELGPELKCAGAEVVELRLAVAHAVERRAGSRLPSGASRLTRATGWPTAFPARASRSEPAIAGSRDLRRPCERPIRVMTAERPHPEG